MKAKKNTDAENPVAICFSQIQPLMEAAKAGNELAASQLTKIAYLSSKFLAIVWAQQPAVVGRISRHYTEFPILRSWRKDSNSKQNKLVGSLELGASLPLKKGGSMRSRQYQRMTDLVLPMLAFDQQQGKLPQFTKSSARKWAKAGVELLYGGLIEFDERSIAHVDWKAAENRAKSYCRKRKPFKKTQPAISISDFRNGLTDAWESLLKNFAKA